MERSEQRPHNTRFVNLTAQRAADTFVVNQRLILLNNMCGKNLHLRQAGKH